MKRILKMAFLIAGTVFAMSACKTENPEPTWYYYGTYLDSTSLRNGFIVKLDNNMTLIPTTIEHIEDKVKDSSRVIAFYTIESKTDSTISANKVEIKGILTKNIIQLTEENKDSIGSDPVLIGSNNIWVSENHLNIIFGYYGGATYHDINLVKPIGNQLNDDDRQILKLKHNRNNDPNYEYYTSIVSFDMRSLYVSGMDSIQFLLQSEDDPNIGTFNWIGTFYFKNKESVKSIPKGIFESSQLVQ